SSSGFCGSWGWRALSTIFCASNRYIGENAYKDVCDEYPVFFLYDPGKIPISGFHRLWNSKKDMKSGDTQRIEPNRYGEISALVYSKKNA
ncbi:MAG: hypothetical protein WC502_05390, partial [Methanolinea sp.]